MALLEYLLMTMEFCTFVLNSFDCMVLLVLIVSILLLCFVLILIRWEQVLIFLGMCFEWYQLLYL